MTQPDPAELKFLRLLQYSSAGCLGITAAFLETMKSINPEVRFELSWRTPVVFVLIAAAAWYVIERVFFRALLAGRPVPVKLVVGFTVFLSLGTLAGFAFSMRGISAERQSDMLVGTTWAVLALTIVGLAFWKVVKFLERDAAKSNDELLGSRSDSAPPERER